MRIQAGPVGWLARKVLLAGYCPTCFPVPKKLRFGGPEGNCETRLCSRGHRFTGIWKTAFGLEYHGVDQSFLKWKAAPGPGPPNRRGE